MSWFTPSRRVWIYNVLRAVLALLILRGVVSADESAAWLEVATQALAIGGLSLARANVSGA